MISENIDKIRDRISLVCERVNRNPSDVALVAASKTFSSDAIFQAVKAGVRDIGENYVQELLTKKDELGAETIRWHHIGHLQTNKVKYIADWISLIHAADNVGLVREIDKRGARAGRIIELLVEVNTTGEASKFGIRPEDTLTFVKQFSTLEHIRIAGLMTIGPFLPDPEGSRPMFRMLNLLKNEVSRLRQSNVEMKHLSMGMTGDFEVAIEEGATLIRIGTAIFGSRTQRA